MPSAALTLTALRLPVRSRLCTPFEQECQLSAGDAGDGSSRSPFEWEYGMPATGSPSPGDDTPEQLEIMQYEGEVWEVPTSSAPRETKTGGGKATNRDHAQPHLSAADSEKGGPGEEVNAEGKVITAEAELPHSSTELKAMNAKQLKALLRSMGLDTKGTKVSPTRRRTDTRERTDTPVYARRNTLRIYIPGIPSRRNVCMLFAPSRRFASTFKARQLVRATSAR